ncbi:hypothetical protein COT12_03245 [Candidatus Berkelbacteria bacterium CG08_land_8_20_14_0_20_39_8]|uniref:PI3K/PI4K catalytic domain-containing protein n=1 Tax=Candidatus Berkelbacteria bacterium CG08_land_8_20_14_0_20_39_8 TaxID=1974511 RepID=A0A2M6YBG3_9BACT|nr:MAG: hypothetical protein COT12_03245 [Candidatus Berkelbacteria bacterium CG08_land_8_20_14_0_20_39_8]
MISENSIGVTTVEKDRLQNRESRFGHTKEIIDLMLNGEVKIIGPIEDFCTDIPKHDNQVDMARIPFKHANRILGVRVQKGDQVAQCIFKPSSGENEIVKRDTQVANFYPRECAAWVVSEYFGFDLVPPTVIREIDGEKGSLQLFLDHSFYKNFDPLENTEATESSRDWQTLAVFDWILANCERHSDNMMIRIDDPTVMAAIDHGIVMSSQNYVEMTVRGPSLQLTHSNIPDQARVIDIPVWLVKQVTDAAVKREELNQQLIQLRDFSKQQIESFWMRVDAIIKYKKFLSKYNHKEATGISFLGAGY